MGSSDLAQSRTSPISERPKCIRSLWRSPQHSSKKNCKSTLRTLCFAMGRDQSSILENTPFGISRALGNAEVPKSYFKDTFCIPCGERLTRVPKMFQSTLRALWWAPGVEIDGCLETVLFTTFGAIGNAGIPKSRFGDFEQFWKPRNPVFFHLFSKPL